MTTLEAQHEVITDLILENKKLKQERDDARDIGEKLSKQGLDIMDENRSLKLERDEAREALMKIEDLFIDGSIQSKLMGQIFAHTNKSWA